MKIAAVLNVHDYPELVADTIESIQHYMTKDILVVRDGAFKGNNLGVTVPNIEGFYHKSGKSPYRNVALGLNEVSSYYDADWYCYLEYDCLVASNSFQKSLIKAQEMNVWMLGCAGRVDEIRMPLIEKMFDADLSKYCYYLLGCCLFVNKKLIDKLKSINFFNRFLHLTNQFSEGFFPGYHGYDLSEHLYPTLTRYFGGNIGVLSTYHDGENKWHGGYEFYPIRFRPELDIADNFPTASILHPLKTYDHEIRQFHRERRQNALQSP